MKMSGRILLADDAPAVRNGVKALLEGKGFEVVGEAHPDDLGKEDVLIFRRFRDFTASMSVTATTWRTRTTP